MKRKLFVLPLLATFLFGCANNALDDLVDENPQGLAFYLQDDGTYGVGAGTSYCLSKVVVPSTYKGKAVTRVVESGFNADRCFGGNKIKTLILPESIKEIEYYGITLWGSLESISLPRSLKKIGEAGVESDCLKEIKYNGTAEEFNKIDFHSRWIDPRDYENEVGPTFKFTDKNIEFNDLFDLLIPTSTSSGVDYDKTETVTHQFRGYTCSIYCFFETSLFGHLRKRTTSEITYSIADESILEFYEDEDLWPWERVQNLIQFRGKSAGTTTVTITCEGLSSNITFNMLPDVAITISEALEIGSQLDSHSSLETYYVLDGYFTWIETYFRFYLSENLDSEVKIKVVYYGKENDLNGVENGTHARVVGRLSGYDEYLYLSGCSFSVLD